jgi:hypothetical protein
VGFLRTQEIPALCPELSSDGLFYRSINNHGLLGGTHRSVVEALADQDVPRSLLYIRRTLDEHGDAAGSDVEGGPAGGARCVYKPNAPVARITAVFSCFIRASVASLEEVVLQLIAAAGRPAFDARFTYYLDSLVSTAHRRAVRR